jgi:hypothetical protein
MPIVIEHPSIFQRIKRMIKVVLGRTYWECLLIERAEEKGRRAAAAMLEGLRR